MYIRPRHFLAARSEHDRPAAAIRMRVRRIAHAAERERWRVDADPTPTIERVDHTAPRRENARACPRALVPLGLETGDRKITDSSAVRVRRRGAEAATGDVHREATELADRVADAVEELGMVVDAEGRALVAACLLVAERHNMTSPGGGVSAAAACRKAATIMATTPFVSSLPRPQT